MVSVDQAEENQRFAAEHGGETFPILSDPSKEMAKAYGVLHPRGFCNRWSFYIDKEGVIQKIDKTVKFVTAGADMAAAIAELGWGSDDAEDPTFSGSGGARP